MVGGDVVADGMLPALVLVPVVGEPSLNLTMIWASFSLQERVVWITQKTVANRCRCRGLVMPHMFLLSLGRLTPTREDLGVGCCRAPHRGGEPLGAWSLEAARQWGSVVRQDWGSRATRSAFQFHQDSMHSLPFASSLSPSSLPSHLQLYFSWWPPTSLSSFCLLLQGILPRFPLPPKIIGLEYTTSPLGECLESCILIVYLSISPTVPWNPLRARTLPALFIVVFPVLRTRLLMY